MTAKGYSKMKKRDTLYAKTGKCQEAPMLLPLKAYIKAGIISREEKLLFESSIPLFWAVLSGARARSFSYKECKVRQA